MRLVRVVVALALLPVLAARVDAAVLHVQVDTDRQQVTVDAADVPLSLLLRQVATRAQLELRLDPAVDHRVTIAARGVPLQQFLDNLGRQEKVGLVLSWRKDARGRQRIAGIAVLPPGQTDATRLPVAVKPPAQGRGHPPDAATKAGRRKHRLEAQGKPVPAAD